jgi:4-amino-4-deoxy-L-arabinose transferase-like glycosyltransferase
MAQDTVPTEPARQARLVPTAPARLWAAAIPRDGPLVPVALYLVALALLTARLGSHPAFPYNWETYTARDVLVFWTHPSWSIVHLTDGVMTDSGLSPLIALPIWLSFHLFGISLTAMRLPIVLLAALAVPLTWLVGRRLAGPGTGALGAALLALSPVFLLYGRTATLVGPSLVPALATIYALLRVLEHPHKWRWLLAVQLLLLLGAYAYSPIRFLWPLSLILFGGELLWRRGERRWFIVALVVTALVLPLGITGAYRFIGYGGWDKEDPAIVSYYSGHGEQLANLRDDPKGIQRYIREPSTGPAAGSATGLAVELVRQNAVDLDRLLTDRQTLPAITDYWNPHGRLYPWFLVPFFVFGSLLTLRRAFSQAEARAWLVLFWGFALPMLLTSRVHIGRLIYIVPLLMLFVALGMVSSAQFLQRGAGRVTGRLGRLPHPAVWRVGATAALLVALLTVGNATWTDYRVAPRAGETARIARLLSTPAEPVPDGAGIVLALAKSQADLEGEGLTVSALEIMLGDEVRFVNLRAAGPVAAPDGRQTVYFGGFLTGATRDLPTFCQNLYIVPTNNLDQFKTVTAQAAAACPAPLQTIELNG